MEINELLKTMKKPKESEILNKFLYVKYKKIDLTKKYNMKIFLSS